MDKDFTEKLDSLLQAQRLPFRDPKEVAKAKVMDRIDEEAGIIPISGYSRTKRILAVAASLAVLIVASWGYTSYETIVNKKQDLVSHTLPDGSLVTLRAHSDLSYHHWSWNLNNRELNFNGTAFFEVKEGSVFTVNTRQGEVSVLGTSFSVVSSDYGLRVSCKTGKVKVEDNTGNETIIEPGEGVEIRRYQTNLFTVKSEDIDGWINGKYDFDNAPLSRVFNVLEDLTGMDVESEVDLDMKYTGSLNGSNTREEMLKLICKPLGLTYTIDEVEEKIIIQKS